MNIKYKKLLNKFYEEENEVKSRELEKELYKKYRTNKSCTICGNQLLISDLKEYKYLCLNCDENFYSIEVSDKKRSNEIE